MQKVLFLDDDPRRTERFLEDVPYAVTVETAKKCAEQLQLGHWDWVFLDHDLGGETFVSSKKANTGMGVVRWILKHPKEVNVKRFIVHTLNHDAGVEMVNKLKDESYNTEKIPFIYLWEWNLVEYLKSLEAD
jgi:hypothetical protein